MNSPQNKIFVFFGILANTLWNLQTCCKIQKSKKIFFVFKKSMQKHFFFLTLNIFFLKKGNSKEVASNWPGIGLQTLSILQLCPCKLGQKSFSPQDSLLSH